MKLRIRGLCTIITYSCKDRKCVTLTMTAALASVTGLATWTEKAGHKLHVDKLSPSIFEELPTKTSCCGTIKPNRIAMSMICGQKMKL
jgi:hypothetical protein